MKQAQRLLGLYSKPRAYKMYSVGNYKVFGEHEKCRLLQLLEKADNGDITDLKTNVFMLLERTPETDYYVRFTFSYIEHGKRIYEIIPATFDCKVLSVYMYLRDKYTKDNVEIRVAYYGKYERNNYRVAKRRQNSPRERFI